MTEGWVKIFTARELFQAKLAEDLLKQNGITSHIVNKPDSVLPFIGNADLYTNSEDAELAVKILAENELLGGETEE
ncbi:MAG: DUF2007 domain-containing protein [Saprospiraceae bacterium]|nr:DUF2007 domain-containing protein [Saprospiraceae bacterium]MDZ4706257.1 DUF2007 domain-containing protein [Saprospiraceae bacterium]